jgi:hypothetical protein
VRRTLLGLTIVVMLLAMTTPAGAVVPSPYTQADTVGDVARPKGDIRSLTVRVQDVMRLTIKVGEIALPTSGAWSNPTGNTFVEWRLFVDTGPSVDWRLVMESSVTGPVIFLFDATGSKAPCSVAANFLTNGNLYRLSFADTCIDEPAQLRARVRLGFDPAGPRGQTIDVAPNNASTPFITHA